LLLASRIEREGLSRENPKMIPQTFAVHSRSSPGKFSSANFLGRIIDRIRHARGINQQRLATDMFARKCKYGETFVSRIPSPRVRSAIRSAYHLLYRSLASFRERSDPSPIPCNASAFPACGDSRALGEGKKKENT